jgi:hypothetical protein
VVYVPGAVPGTRMPGNEAMTVMDVAINAESENLEKLGIASQVAHFTMAPIGSPAPANAVPLTSVSLFDQGLSQVLQAAVIGLEPERPYVLAFSERSDGSGKLEPLASFMTNPAGAAIVNALATIRQVAQGDVKDNRRYVVVAPGSMTEIGKPVQIQGP